MCFLCSGDKKHGFIYRTCSCSGIKELTETVWIVKQLLLFSVTKMIHREDGVSSVSPSSERRANARNVSTSSLPYGGITYLINSFDYPNLLCFNSPSTQHQFL